MPQTHHEKPIHPAGCCEKLWLVSLPWNYITSDTECRPAGAGRARCFRNPGRRPWRHRRHEAPPRVTGKPSATLRLRHPGAPAPDKKDPHQLVASLLSRVVVGGKVFVWRPACGRQRRLLGATPLFVRIRGPSEGQRSRGSPSVLCDV